MLLGSSSKGLLALKCDILQHLWLCCPLGCPAWLVREHSSNFNSCVLCVQTCSIPRSNVHHKQ